VFDTLRQLEARYRDLEAQLADPEVAGDGQRYTALARQHAELAPSRRRLPRVARDRRPTIAALRRCSPRRAGSDRVRRRDRRTRRPRQPSSRGAAPAAGTGRPERRPDVILEIRAAAGGDEAGLFAGELTQMYLATPSGGGGPPTSCQPRRRGSAGSRRRSSRSSGAVRTRTSSTSRASTGSSVSPRPSRRAGSTPRPRRWPSCPPPRRSTSRCPPGRAAHRRVPIVGARGAEREHHRLGGAHHPPADRARGRLPGREVPAPEP
jgi:hypothetical protein